MNANLAAVLPILHEATRGYWNVRESMDGPAMRLTRQRVMSILANGPGGKALPLARCGINALQYELFRQAEIEGATVRDLRENFAAFCRENFRPEAPETEEEMKTPTADLVEEFDTAAQIWGWERDQGSGSAVRRAEAEYGRTKKALLRRIRRLESGPEGTP